MADDAVVYTSKVRIERVKGPLRRAFLPAEEEPVLFGVHSEVAQHYGVDPAVHEPHATHPRLCGLGRGRVTDGHLWWRAGGARYPRGKRQTQL